MIMICHIKRPLPPCGGELGWGVFGEAPECEERIDRGKALPPPTLVLSPERTACRLLPPATT